jgi:hypothetical protein
MGARCTAPEFGASTVRFSIDFTAFFGLDARVGRPAFTYLTKISSMKEAVNEPVIRIDAGRPMSTSR